MSAKVFDLAACRRQREPGIHPARHVPVVVSAHEAYAAAAVSELRVGSTDAITALEAMAAACRAWRDKLRGVASAARAVAQGADTLAAQAKEVGRGAAAVAETCEQLPDRRVGHAPSAATLNTSRQGS